MSYFSLQEFSDVDPNENRQDPDDDNVLDDASEVSDHQQSTNGERERQLEAGTTTSQPHDDGGFEEAQVSAILNLGNHNNRGANGGGGGGGGWGGGGGGWGGDDEIIDDDANTISNRSRFSFCSAKFNSLYDVEDGFTVVKGALRERAGLKCCCIFTTFLLVASGIGVGTWLGVSKKGGGGGGGEESVAATPPPGSNGTQSEATPDTRPLKDICEIQAVQNTEKGHQECTEACMDGMCCFSGDSQESCKAFGDGLCDFFAPCEVLVDGGGAEEEVDPDWSAPFPPAPTNLKSVCSLKSTRTENGFAECEMECLEALCCWPQSGQESCYKGHKDSCEVYAPCYAIHGQMGPSTDGDSGNKPGSGGSDAYTTDDDLFSDGEDWGKEERLGNETVPTAKTEPEDLSTTPIPDDDWIPPAYGSEELTEEEMVEMVKELCAIDEASDSIDACHGICYERPCCFVDDPEYNCAETLTDWCEDFAPCADADVTYLIEDIMSTPKKLYKTEATLATSCLPEVISKDVDGEWNCKMACAGRKCCEKEGDCELNEDEEEEFCHDYGRLCLGIADDANSSEIPSTDEPATEEAAEDDSATIAPATESAGRKNVGD